MSQRYKVRLSDGTTLSVDREGLEGFLNDEGAMVQAPGLQQWRPLRVLVAALERSSRRSAPPASQPMRSAPVAGAVAWPGSDAPIGSPRGVVGFADEIAARDSVVDAGPIRHEDLPVIPLKPRDDESRGQLYDPGVYRDHLRVETSSRDARDEKILGMLALLVAGYTRAVRSVEPFLRRVFSSAAIQAGVVGVGSWVEQLGASRRARRSGGPASAPAEDEALRSAAAAAPSSAPPPAVERFSAPLPIAELPVVPLAAVPREEADAQATLYGEGPRWERAWRWTRRVVVAGSVVGAAAAAALHREAWLPRAEGMTRSLFHEIDAQARSSDDTGLRARLTREAREQLPHIAPVTFELLLGAQPNPGEELASLFRLSSDALDRGVAALGPAGARELAALRAELLAGVSPEDRERLAAYDRARSYRATLPFEDREARAAFARGVRALPPGSRARLQALSGEAIAAGIRTVAAEAAPRP
jgi:hypothetical protein